MRSYLIGYEVEFYHSEQNNPLIHALHYILFLTCSCWRDLIAEFAPVYPALGVMPPHLDNLSLLSYIAYISHKINQNINNGRSKLLTS